ALAGRLSLSWKEERGFCMLLAIDISNTNIKFGLYNSETMKHHWVVSTARQRTTDEYAMLLSELTRYAGYHFTDIDDIILSSVVPPINPVFLVLDQLFCGNEAHVVDTYLVLGTRVIICTSWVRCL